MKREAFQQMLDKASKSVQRLNRDLARVCPKPSDIVGAGGYSPASASAPAARPSRRIRQDHKPLLNKLETEFQAWITPMLQGKSILRAQAKRYKLGNGIWFKVDFTAQICGRECAFEVKGPHAFRGGFENLKMAAHEWPEVRWVLAWKENGEWKTQEVLP